MPFNLDLAAGNLLGYDPNQFRGLLDPVDIAKAKQQAILGTGLGLLNAGGRSLQPINFGQAFAQAAMMGQQQGQGALQQSLMMRQAMEQKAARDAAAQQQAKLREALAKGDIAGAAAIDPRYAKDYRDAMAAPEGPKPQAFQGPDGSIRWAVPGQNLGPLAKVADPAADAEARAKAEKERFDKEKGLRAEFTGQQSVKDFQVVRDGFSKVAGAALNPTPAGDLSLVFGYMKMLDPSSSVREGEYANAANAAGVPERIRTAWNNALKGDGLGPEQRADFLAQAQRIYQSQYSQVQNLDKTYSDLASQYQVNPDLVTPEFGIPKEQLDEYTKQIQSVLQSLKPGESVQVDGATVTKRSSGP
jgi:hypothetical protein